MKSCVNRCAEIITASIPQAFLRFQSSHQELVTVSEMETGRTRRFEKAWESGWAGRSSLRGEGCSLAESDLGDRGVKGLVVGAGSTGAPPPSRSSHHRPGGIRA